MKIPKTFTSLGFRDYRLLWLSSAMANSGQYAFTVSASWLIFSLSKSSVLVGLIMFATMISGVVFGPIVGVLVDRFDRRKLLSFAIFFNACNTGCLALLSATGLATPWLVIGSAFLLGIFFNLQMTCTNTILPNIVPKQSLFNATALQGSVQQGSAFLGSAMASPLLAFVGPVSVFALCWLLYTLAGIQSLWIRVEQPKSTLEKLQIKKLFQPVMEGVVYIRKTPALGLLILIVFLHCLLTMAYTSMLPQFIQDDLAADSGIYGTLMMFIGLGAILGNLCTASITSPRKQGILYILMAVGSGLSLLALGLTKTSIIAFIVGFIVGGSQAVFMAISLSFVLQRANDEFRGRVASVNFIMASGAMAIGNFLYGSISKAIQPNISMLLSGGIFVMFIFVLVLVSPTLRSLYQKPALANDKQMSGVV
ncbi:MFS transporter [Bacillus sp. APMAM]|nr:MFS transporter [Bacillus sp. APMAM]RTZ56143.1 MFS transporter [Bacillus sp. SAJ1]